MNFGPLTRTPQQKIEALQTALTKAENRIAQLEILMGQIRKTLEAKGIQILPRKAAGR